MYHKYTKKRRRRTFILLQLICNRILPKLISKEIEIENQKIFIGQLF